MRKLSRLIPLFVVALMLVSAALSARAQESGGIIIEGNFGGDPKTMNPILASDTASYRVSTFLFPALIGIEPKSGTFQPDQLGGLAKSWDISKDGLTYTFHLKNTYKWTDGQPVTAADYKFSYDAVAGGKIDSPLTPQTQERIAGVSAPDANTVVVTFKEQSCTALSDIANIYILPAHAFKPDASDMKDSAFNTDPTITSSVFKFGQFRPSEQIALVANQDYPDTLKGKVLPEGYIYKIVPDQTVLVEQFLAGETNVIDTPPVSRRSDIKAAADAGKVQVYDFPGNSWDYVGWNLADPTNPVSAADDKGTLTNADQGHHPLFGDVRVRQAMALGTNVDQIIKTAVFGQGTRMAAGIIPASWAFDPTLKPLPFDPAAAGKLLDQAGFPMGPNGVRVAKGAMYAKDGTPFKFTMYTNEGNARRKAIGTIMQDNLKQIGVQVDFQTIDFNTLLDKMSAETFDAFILGWQNGFPDDPDQTNIFTPIGDVVSNAYNTGSYNNPQLTKLESDALHVSGCATDARAAIYKQIQKIMQDDQPYMFLFAQNGEYAASSTVKGFMPYPSNPFWNVDEWTVASK